MLAGEFGIPEDYVAPWRSLPPDAHHPVRRVFDDGLAIWVETAEDFEREAPEVLAAARAANLVCAFTAMPLSHEGQSIGALSFSYDGEHRFTDDERQFLAALARTCEQALERARLYVAEAEARKRAEAASVRKDEFLAMLGHELRNPLASIVSAIDVIKLRGGELTRELAIVDRQAHHLAHVVNALVDVSRLTKGKIALNRGDVVLAETVQHAIDTVRAAIDTHQHQLIVTVPQDIVVDADRERLCQVLANLLANAVKYTPDLGRIEIVARPGRAFVEIEVRDNGIGIAPALLPHVFDAFVQGPRDMARREGGLGIGLTIVRMLVELHGGSIAVRSDSRGSTFTVRWPKALTAAQCQREYTKGVRCTKPVGHAGVHEYQRATGEMFYWT